MDDQPRYYLIKNGMYYRPDSKGYTSSFLEAGMFGEDYARSHCANTQGVTKVAEEAGEVVKAGVHISEGRDFTHEDLEGEVVDAIAMLIRVLIEGDQVHGLPPSYGRTPA